MPKKFYAIAKGKKTGIFTNWSECREYVSGVSGAVYKSFLTLEEAKAFLDRGYQSFQVEDADGIPKADADIYVDGSFNVKTGEYSYGMLVIQDGMEEEYNRAYSKDALSEMRNVAGEIMGARAAMEYALSKKLSCVNIFYDYEGIAKWCLGDWKANKDGTKAYAEYYRSIKTGLQVNFVKVKGHSNHEYNDRVDALAKKALGLL